MARWLTLTLATVALAAIGSLLVVPTSSYAGTLWLKSCTYFGDSGTATDVDGAVWQPQGTSAFSLTNRCPLGGSFQITPAGHMPDGTSAQWHTVTPPTIGITGALTPLNQVLVLPASNFDGFQASYFWNGGSQTVADEGNCCGGMDYGLGINRNDLNGSHYFGFYVTCIASGGCDALNGGGQLLDVRGIELTGEDNTPPSITALGLGNLWYQTSRWVRGVWPLSFQATDDSGVCGMRAIVDGQSLQGPTAVNDQSSWTQCPTPQTMTQSIDTAGYPDGALSLLLSAADAASPANVSSPTETVYIDNQPVNLNLTGPTDALSTAGTQYVGAVASAGPSGVADIQCSVDGAPYVSHGGSSAQIPVLGIGEHSISCYAQNRAIDSNLDPASSALQTWNLSIRQPTISGITFGSRVVDALRCHRVRVLVEEPARWVTIHRHGKRIWVHRRATTRVEHAVRCHPRVVIRKVRIHGHTRRERIVLLPHTVQLSKMRIRFGHATTVSGWVGTADGTALADAPVRIVTATDNGLDRWRVATVATTSSDGLWQATVPAGPSRLIAAIYPGSGTTEPATSGQVQLIVPTKVSLKIRPRRARWSHTIQISGRVLGGNIPAGKLLRLRIGTASIYSTVGIPDISRNGRYRTTWTFAPGRGVVHYWFSVSTLPEADYPYAQTSSPRVYVTVHG
jgi:hypothetical protein